jgi:CheY-like chemotaxis protein
MSTENPCCQSILVVEDDDDIRNVMIDVLESEGYHAEAATNGKEALDLLHTINKPCLVLLDMMMPIMNGREFLDKVMEDSYLAPIPILIVSAVADKTNTKGAVGFLKKPVDIDMVLKMVDQYCKGAFIEAGPRPGSEAQSPHP